MRYIVVLRRVCGKKDKSICDNFEEFGCVEVRWLEEMKDFKD